jgi:hypothetical protein
MYLNKSQLSQTFSNLLNKLNPNGKLIIIEPNISGLSYRTGFGLLTFLQKKRMKETSNTGGTCFSFKEINNLVHNAGGVIIKEQRIPISTFFFLLIYIIGKLFPKKWAATIFRYLTSLDDLLKTFKLPSIWIFTLVQKK